VKDSVIVDGCSKLDMGMDEQWKRRLGLGSAGKGQRVAMVLDCAVHNTWTCQGLTCTPQPLPLMFILRRGFEHCIANLYLIPLSMFLGSGISVGKLGVLHSESLLDPHVIALGQ